MGPGTGSGGLGDDLLEGGDGSDVFIFDTQFGAGNIDTIAGFRVGADVIHLDNAVFRALADGDLSTTAFSVGATATTVQHRVIYDPANGHLLFDADGSGSVHAVHVATLALGLELKAVDFLVI